MQPLTLCKVTKAQVESGEASSKTKRRRSDELSLHRGVVSGGSAQVQLSDEIRRLDKRKREDLLACISNTPIRIPALHSLSMKADLHIPWNTLRNLRR